MKKNVNSPKKLVLNKNAVKDLTVRSGVKTAGGLHPGCNVSSLLNVL